MLNRWLVALTAGALASACSPGAAPLQSAPLQSKPPVSAPTESATITATAATAAAPSAAAAAPADARPSDLLVLRGAAGARVIDAASGAVVATANHGIAAPDGATLVGIAAGKLTAVDSTTGASNPLGRATASLVPVVTTRDGGQVALAQPAQSPTLPGYIAPGRTTSRIAVSTAGGVPKVFDLAGNYQPEAFSADGGQLFVIEYRPPAAPDRYRVRQLDLATGAVNGVLGPQKVLLDEEMRGIGRMQLLDEQRSVLYTLYRTVGDDRAFVHTLHLAGWAHCVVLPPEFGRAGADTAMALAPSGALYAWDGSNISEVNGEEVSVRRTVAVPGNDGGGHAAITVADNGTIVTLAGRVVTEIDPSSLQPKISWSLPAPASSVALSPDGRRLFFGSGTDFVTVERASHREIARVPAGPGERIADVLQPK